MLPSRPWHLDVLKPFDVRYLSGFNPETFKISPDKGSIEAKEIMDQAKKLGTKIGISNKTCSELSAFVL